MTKEVERNEEGELIDPRLVLMLKTNYPEIFEQSVAEGATISDLIGVIIMRLDQMLVESQDIVKQAEAMLDEHSSPETKAEIEA